MSSGGATRWENPPDIRPGALLLGGLRRGALLVFLPVFVVGQILAWLTYAASGWYHPWSWFKIGVAQTLASVRVAFVTGGQDPATLQLAIGALTMVVLVLAFRAGREQARGLERRPAHAALAGSQIALGFAVPMFLAAFPVTLGFPQFGIDDLHAVQWQALLLPLVVGSAAGAVGGLTAAAKQLLTGSVWDQRVAVAAHGGATALWWSVVLAFVGFLAVAAASPGPTGAYARYTTRGGGSGPVLVIEHAALMPNQSVLVLTTAMGATTFLAVGGEPAVEITRSGVTTVSAAGGFLAAYTGATSDHVALPSWFAAFLLVPLGGTLLGGRTAGMGTARSGERAVRGLLAGVVFAIASTVAAWGATLVVPAWAGLVGGSLTLGPVPATVFVLSLAWGVVGCTFGAFTLPKFARARSATRPR
jgi:hypothetical protein